MELPNVWGKGGALFAFSGFDGETDWRRPFVGSTASEGRGIFFHTEAPASLHFRLLQGAFSAQDEVVAGDVISSLISFSKVQVRIRYLFLDKDTVIGEAMAVEADEPAQVGFAVSVEGADAEPRSGGCVYRAGEEAFALAASGPEFRVEEAGVYARLERGDSLKFAFVYDSSSGSAYERAVRALSADQEKLYADRIAFFERLPAPKSRDSSLRKTYYKCASVQKVNSLTAEGEIRFNWTTPDRWPHRHMWIWDSVFHALGLRHFAPEWARDSIKAVLSKQRSDGFIPITMTPDGSREAEIVQPPILAWGAWKVYEIVGDEEFIHYCYPRLKAMVLWDCEHLDADGNGLCEWIAGNASGMDNSPRFDQPVGDAVDLNSYLVNDMAYLEKMARLLGLEDDVRMWAEMHAARSAKINELLWDEETGFYYDLSPEGEKIRIKTEAGFTPLFAGVCSREQAAALVKHLASPTEFRRTFPVSSVSADEPSFSDDMWRGPVWINYNRFIIEGLEKYGCRELAMDIRDATLREIARWYECDGVIYEFYDSEGERSPSELHRKEKLGIQPDHWMTRCVRDYHWTAAIFVDLILDSGEMGDL